MIEYELSSTATGVCVHCIFLESTLTECVVVVHQRISQLSPPGLINIESSHRFNRSGNTAYGCIDGLMTNSTDYRISVVGGNLTTQVQGGQEFLWLYMFMLTFYYTVIARILAVVDDLLDNY